MSKLTLVAMALALGAGALGGAAYQKVALVQTEVSGLQSSRSEQPAPASKASVDALERDVSRLGARVTALELRAQSTATQPAEAPAPAGAPGAADDPTPAEKDRRRRSPYDVGPVPKDAVQREERKQMVGNTVAEHWKAWGAKHGLTARQTADLAALESDAAKRRLDNQAKLADGEITQPETRSRNQALADEVRKKAQSLLPAEQLAQFEAEKGAEWGSSYRKVREADAREGSGGN